MRGLPFALTTGPLLAQVMREAHRDRRRFRPCSRCGTPMPIEPDRGEQTVHCPSCSRRQRVTVAEDVPWRLTASSAEALRRTGTWLRRL
jgi:DNA-directed RNA polymerase subunit RPC12/RpoP